MVLEIAPDIERKKLITFEQFDQLTDVIGQFFLVRDLGAMSSIMDTRLKG